MDKNKKAPIEPPKQSKYKALVRGIAEGAAGVIPGLGILTNMLRVISPPENEKKTGEWQKNISERTNDNTDRIEQHNNAINPQKTLAGATGKLIYHLAKSCPDGLGHKYYELKDMQAMIPDEATQAVEDAAYELKSLGLIEIDYVLSGPWSANLTPEFYEQIDHQVMGWNTHEDAVSLARKMLEMDTGSANELHEATGWGKRRFNPAFRYILYLFPDGRIRKSLQPDYPSLGVVMTSEDKAQLRRFIQDEAA